MELVIIYDNIPPSSGKNTHFNPKIEAEALVFPAGVLASRRHIPEMTQGDTLKEMPDFKAFRSKMSEPTEVQDVCGPLSPAYELRRQLVALRQEAGFTQEEVADILNTNKSNISRLESVSSSISPKFSTITEYADAVGYNVRIEFVRKSEQEHNKGLLREAE